MDSKDLVMTKANYVTLARIFLVPILLVILLTELENKAYITFVIFIVAALSDSLDGHLARKYQQVSALGKFLDPLADKLLVASVLIALVYLQEVETWVATIIILREIIIGAFRYYSLVNDASFSASIPSKIKTTLQLISLGTFIIYQKLPFPGLLFVIATVLIYLSMFLGIYSGFDYFVKYSRALRRRG